MTKVVASRTGTGKELDRLRGRGADNSALSGNGKG